jgi:hypothetical protein
MTENITISDKIDILNNNIYRITNDLEHNINAKNEELSIDSPSSVVLNFVEGKISTLQQQKTALIEELNRLTSQI